MEWLRTGRLLEDQDLKVFELEPTASTILTCNIRCQEFTRFEIFVKQTPCSLHYSPNHIALIIDSHGCRRLPTMSSIHLC